MQLIDRALNALEILSQNMNGMSVTDLAEQLGIPASSTHRILSSLKGNHFVVQDEHTKKYRLGYKIWCRKGKCADAGGTDAYAQTGGKD
jgi:DNA-binding IclR family transcriptional regulator